MRVKIIVRFVHAIAAGHVSRADQNRVYARI